MYFLVDLVRETVRIFCDTAPFLLFGFFLAGVLHVLIPRTWLRAALGRGNFRSVLLASLGGIPLPLCSCSVLPTAAELRKGGASRGAVASFVISTPETGVDSISLTYALMDPLMTVARPLAALGTALASGTAVNALERGQDSSSISEAEAAMPGRARPLKRGDGAPGAAAKLRGIVSYAYGELLDDIASWFIIGMALTGLISVIIPVGALQNPNLSGLPAMLLMLVIGIPLYVCAISSTPLAAVLIAKGLSPGTALVFLLAGPATNAASLTVLTKLIGKRAVIIHLASIAIVSLLAGWIVDGIYRSTSLDATALAGKGGEFIPDWVRIPAALLLFGLLVCSAIRTDLLRVWREGLRRLGKPLHLDLGGRPAVAVYLVAVVLLYLLSGCSVVPPGETAWVVNFGKVVRAVEQPGLVLHWPYPFATVAREQPQRVRSIARGFRREDGAPVAPDWRGRTTQQTELTREAEIATGDENLLAVRYTVHYTVADAFAYHFRLDDPSALVASFAEYALRRVMCEMETDSILVNHHRELQERVARKLRAELNGLDAGISVLRVDLQHVHAPQEVHFAFRDVASALEDNHRFIRQAESYRNRVVAAARARAFSEAKRAEGEKLLRLAEATGRANGFRALEETCRQARGITRLRLYLDAAALNLARARVILPLTDLPLDLWLQRDPSARSWREPWAAGRTGVPEPATTDPSASPPATPPTGWQSDNPARSIPPQQEEGWREKMRRLQERPR